MAHQEYPWKKPDGNPVACKEKIKVLNENYAEIREAFQEALDDAVLMGCSVDQIKKIYRDMIDETSASYREIVPEEPKDE